MAMPQQTSVDPVKEAERVLVEFGNVSLPVPVERIAKQLGIQVRFSPLDQELSGMIFIKDGVPIVGVNSIHHPNRQRFTIAHEIGHYILHRELLTSEVHVDKQFPALMRDENSATGTESIEIQANRFASCLLMPQVLLDQALKGRHFDIDDPRPLEELAKRFRVSKQALDYRIGNRF
jgi:Zn-dependent peptidase ImmA (M78 family)